MDISSGGGYPSSKLSNFAPNPFEIDGVACSSMEGFLQALKYKDIAMQVYVCTLSGKLAKSKGAKKDWKNTQTLWWQGVAYKRNSLEYQYLLDRAYTALATNTKFRQALLSTRGSNLTHSKGKKKKSQTVITEREFCSRLMCLRTQIQE